MSFQCTKDILTWKFSFLLYLTIILTIDAMPLAQLAIIPIHTLYLCLQWFVNTTRFDFIVSSHKKPPRKEWKSNFSVLISHSSFFFAEKAYNHLSPFWHFPFRPSNASRCLLSIRKCHRKITGVLTNLIPSSITSYIFLTFSG